MNAIDEKLDTALEKAFSEKIDLILEAEQKRIELIGASAQTGGAIKQYQTVSPEAKRKLMGILKHYAKMQHPFAACVRDNRKRFGPRAEAVCAVLKDIIRGTTKWRGHNNPKDKGSPGLSSYQPIDDGLLLDEETASLVDRLSEQDLWDLLGLASLSSETS